MSVDTCDRCGKSEPGIGWIASGYRKIMLRKGLPDPGNLCGSCAGRDTGKRIAETVSKQDAQP